MKMVRPFALVTLGMLLGGGLVAAGAQLGATRPVPADRLEIGDSQFAGSYRLRFIRDTMTGTCYLAATADKTVPNGPREYTITAMTQADQTACVIK